MKKQFLPILVSLLMTFFTACKREQKKDLNSNTTSNVKYKNPEWANKLIEAYEAFNKNRNLHSAELVFSASEKMPVKN